MDDDLGTRASGQEPGDPDDPEQPVGREAVRAALMDAAIALLAERSSASISVREIATHANVQHSLVFRHFGDKETLLRDSMARYFDAMAQQVANFRDLDDALDQILGMSGAPPSLALNRACVEGIPFPDSIGVPNVTGRFAELVAEEQARRGGTPRHDPLAITVAVFDMIGGMRIYRDLSELTARAAGRDPVALRRELRELVFDFLEWSLEPPRPAP
ncbi:MAG: TetR/AcrR family transcriptional regulator [Acidimicrobiales bacterium]|jgi:AcrR family transcriptional regulator|nr:TetR/AcrR family transcriptional regulator [Acidimicrobiales bacterium]